MKRGVFVLVLLVFVLGAVGALTVTRVPDVTGLPRDEAQMALLATGLRTGDMLDFRATEADPLVFAAYPEPGSIVWRGSEVDLILARDCVRCR